MRLAYYIARRYLFAPKKHRAVNVISALSACGVALATVALVCTLSVFNGFQEMVAGFFTAFDPELKITARRGTVFHPADSCLQAIRRLPQVAVWSETLEENALVRYHDRQTTATVKGVDNAWRGLASVDSLLYGGGEFILRDSVVSYAIPGVELMSELGCGIAFVDPLELYAPRHGARINVANPYAGLRHGYLHSSGPDQVSAIELRLTPDADPVRTQRRIQELAGPDYLVQNRYEQQADVFRIMTSEKLIAYLFLTLILMMACFNVVGSLSMLMLEKRDDVRTLCNLGADTRLVQRIFRCEGGLIVVCGAVVGIGLGWLLCLAQQQFGFIRLGSAGEFVTDAFPVSVQGGDIAVVFVTVTLVGGLAVWQAVRYLGRRLL